MNSRRVLLLVGAALLMGACNTADPAEDSQQRTAALALPNAGTAVSTSSAVPSSTGSHRFDSTKALVAPRGPDRAVQANAGTGTAGASKIAQVAPAQTVP
jgi:hypothetical protein